MRENVFLERLGRPCGGVGECYTFTMKEDQAMKEILYKKQCDTKNKTKNFSVSQSSEDKDSLTGVSKSFQYKVVPAAYDSVPPPAPQVFMKKSFDTKARVESFDFQVKGFFYITHNRNYMKVNFHHTLHIEIHWKTASISPQKSVILTK